MRFRKGRFAPELKELAVALAREIGPNHAAPKLGVSYVSLRKWMLQADLRETCVMVKRSPEQEEQIRLAQKEIRRLQRENVELKKANWILRKVAEVFSKDRRDGNSSRSETFPNKKRPKS